MTCPICLSETEHLICPYHVVSEEQWAQGNRILCDGLHRGKWAKRLAPEEREAAIPDHIFP